MVKRIQNHFGLILFLYEVVSVPMETLRKQTLTLQQRLLYPGDSGSMSAQVHVALSRDNTAEGQAVPHSMVALGRRTSCGMERGWNHVP